MWEASKNGSFSLSSFFKAILNNLGEKSTMCSIWELKAPPRVLVFGSLALRNRITYYGFLKEERDDYCEWLAYVL